MVKIVKIFWNLTILEILYNPKSILYAFFQKIFAFYTPK